MLSPNTLLSKGRYRIDTELRRTAEWSLYSADDLAVSQKVVAIEYSRPDARLETVKHDGLITTLESFPMNGRYVEITEAVSRSLGRQPLHAVWDRFAVIMMGLNALTSAHSRQCVIAPETVFRAADARLKLLPLPTPAGPLDIESWHVPMEAVWGELDHISQKAIYNGWTEKAVHALEEPADESSDIYSLAAIFYRELTGVTPAGAFERTVVGLDGADPLVEPLELVSELSSEASEYLVRCLSLRREERFRTFEDALMNLPSVTEPADDERHDVLEVIATPPPGRAVNRTQPTLNEIRLESTLHPDDEPFLIEKRPEEFARFAPRSEAEPAEVFKCPPASVAFANDELRYAETEADLRELEDVDPIFSAEAATRRSPSKLVFAAAALVALGGTGWGIYQYGGFTDVPQAPPVAKLAAPPASQTVEITPAPLSTPDAVLTTTATPDTTAPARTSVQTAAAVQAKAQSPSKPAPAAPTKTKKVTVDDLINDN